MSLRKTVLFVILWSVPFGILTGCGEQLDDRTLESRPWIVEEPIQWLQRDAWVESQEVRRWTFGGALDLGGWQLNLGPDEWSTADQSLEIKARGRIVELENVVDLDAEEVDVVDLELRGLVRRRISVQWAGPGQAFSEKRRLQTTSSTKLSGGRRRYRLEVSGHPAWRGEIERVRCTLQLSRSYRGEVRSIALLKNRVKHAMLEQAASQNWKIDIDNEVRPGWVVLPSKPRLLTLDAGPNTSLKFAIGAFGGLVEPTTFRVWAGSRDQRRSAPLHEEVLSKGLSGHWLERSVSLPNEEGGAIEVALEFEGGASLDATSGVPVVGSLSIVRPTLRSRPNVILMSVDTLRADHLSLYGYERNTSPHIDDWAARGAVVFEDAVASAPWTLPSHASMFSGLDAIRHGVNHYDGVPNSVVMLPEILRSSGFATLAVTGGGFVHSRLGFSQGFDRYRSFSNKMGFKGELDIGVQKVLELLEEYRNDEFFLFFHTYSVHNPFRPRQPDYSELTGQPDTELVVDVVKLEPRPDDGYLQNRRLAALKNGVEQEVSPQDVMAMAVDLYDGAIRYTDRAIGRILGSLDELGLSENTIVILTSDHGELFGEHGQVNHYSLFRENLHVPLIIYDPRSPARGIRVLRQVRSVDIVPTVCELLDLPIPDGIDGLSRVASMRGEPGGVREDAVAMSYAANSNYGLLLRHPEGLAYRFRNTAWRTTENREELVRFGEAGETPIALDQAGESLGRLRRQATAALADQLPGARVLVDNRAGTTSIRGTLRGRGASIGTIKVVEAEDAILERGPVGGAQFLVSAGESALWILEGLEPSRIFLDVDGSSHQLIPGRDGTATSLRRVGGKWTIDDTSEAPRNLPAVSLWWSGPRDLAGSVVPEMSDELREQLEALGYLE